MYHTSKFHEIFYTCNLWPWLDPSLTAVQYVTYFRLCGWLMFSRNRANRPESECFVQFARWRHLGRHRKQSLPSPTASCFYCIFKRLNCYEKMQWRIVALTVLLYAEMHYVLIFLKILNISKYVCRWLIPWSCWSCFGVKTFGPLCIHRLTWILAEIPADAWSIQSSVSLCTLSTSYPAFGPFTSYRMSALD